MPIGPRPNYYLVFGYVKVGLSFGLWTNRMFPARLPLKIGLFYYTCNGVMVSIC